MRGGILKENHEFSLGWRLAGWLPLALGLGFYLSFRGGLGEEGWGSWLQLKLPWIWGSAPSLLQAVSGVLLLVTVVRLRLWLSIAAVLAATLLWEFGQAQSWWAGTYDFNDLVASCIGGGVAGAFLAIAKDGGGRQRPPHLIKGLVILVLNGVFAVATSQPVCVNYDKCYHIPRYMSYEKFRASYEVRDDVEFEFLEGLVVEGNGFVFANVPNLGVHVFDNTDPSRIQYVSFLNILGNRDLEVRGNRLYADSFIDLLVIDIQEGTTTFDLVQRVEDFFDYDFVFSNVSFTLGPERPLNPKAGVPIGYRLVKERDGDFIFKGTEGIACSPIFLGIPCNEEKKVSD